MGFFRRTEAPLPSATGEPTAEPTVAHPQSRDVATEPPAEPPKKQGWFQRLKAGLTKTSARLSEDIAGLFTKRKLDADSLQELEDLLIQADLGVETAMRITAALAKGRYNKEIAPEEVRAVLAAEVERTLAPVAKPLRLDGQHRPHVILVVGVNGTGKTTTIGKLAHKLSGEGKKVTLAAGDTFRAAAVEQLQIWGERTGAEVIARAVGADSAGLAYDALGRARENGSDVLLIDTAGRLQNKQALMDELEKVIRVLRKIDPLAPHQVLLVLDATTGQNALNQVEIFKEKAGVTGLVMTKLDGTARGGILVAISAKFGLPVHAIGIGESVEDLAGFDANEFARAIALS
jgi:fused signal recognition particle receptor